MSYLKFDKTQLTNLQDSLKKEVLRTNNSGGYSCTSIVGCNTRKYHGLLVVQLPQIDNEHHVLLSSLDETVIQHGAEFNLGLHKYQGNNYSPNGHKYAREFYWDQAPTTLYNVGGVILKKELMFEHKVSRLMIRYTLVEAHSATTLRLQPFLAFRNVRRYTHENAQASRDYKEVSGGIKTCMYPGYPELYMQVSKKNDFVYRPDWYRGIEYSREQERGYSFNEDLYVPGYFEFSIKKGESVVFSAGLDEVKPSTLKKSFEHELEVRFPRDSFLNTLINASHQFQVARDGEHYIVAGYPWFACRARDTFISLPGLTLSIGEPHEYIKAMDSAMKALDDFIEGRPISVQLTEVEHPDVLLWAVWCIQQFAKSEGEETCYKLYGEMVERIVNFIIDGKHPNLFLHDNGLVYSNGRDRAITWMNSSVNGRPVVPRTGYIVEFNALWYNALRYLASVKAKHEGEAAAQDLEKLADKVAVSFRETFLNEYGYLFDYVDGNMMDWSVRPNMVLAVALDYSPLDLHQRKAVLDIVTKELLTPKGLRSLSPKSGGYNPMYVGPQLQRDYAYHSGTAWPWLEGFYLEAILKTFKMSRVSFVERQLVGFEEELNYHCIGTLPELFDGNPPFHGRGAMAFAMNVAEILRVLHYVDKFMYKEDKEEQQ